MKKNLLFSIVLLFAFASIFAQETTNVAQVSNESEFKAALLNAAITEIEIQSDIDFTTTGGELSGEVNATIPARSLIVRGNNKTVDFHHYSAWMDNLGVKVDVLIENIKMYGQSYWGPFRLVNVAPSSSFTYQDVYYEGSQVTASYSADVFIEGKVEAKSVYSYLRPIDPTKTALTMSNGDQQNFEVKNISFKENSEYIGSTYNGMVFELRQAGSGIIKRGAKVSLTGNGNLGQGLPTTFLLEGNLLIEEGAELNITIPEESEFHGWFGKESAKLTRGGIYMMDNATLDVKSGAKLNIIHHGYPNDEVARALIRIGTNAKVLVEDKASLNVHATNAANPNPTTLIRTTGAASFVIGEKANFNISAKGTGDVRLIRMYGWGGASSFDFKNANLVSLDLTGNTNPASRLIFMETGQFKADVQKVTTTNRDNTETVYAPMYAMKISYVWDNVTAVEAKSSVPQMQTDFIENYRTQNFKKVVFEYIPDITLKMPGLGDNVTRENSHTVKGKTNPGVYLEFSSDEFSFPEGTVAHSDHEGNERKFHLIADAEGNFTYSLPTAQFFSVGDKIKVYATLHGKKLERTLLVVDETAPEKAEIKEIVIEDTQIKGTSEEQSTVAIFNADISSNTEIKELISKINNFYNPNYDDLLFDFSQLGNSPEDAPKKVELQGQIDAVKDEFEGYTNQLNTLLEGKIVSSTEGAATNRSLPATDFSVPAPNAMSLGNKYWALTRDRKGNVSISESQIVKNKFIEITATKVWKGTPIDQTTPAITLTLKQNDQDFQSPITIAAGATGDDLNVKWSNVPKYDETEGDNYGKKFEYTLVERKVAKYNAIVTGDTDNGFIVTNTYDATATGVNQIQSNANISFYPNPAINILNIESDKKIEKVELFNSLGASVLRIEANQTEKLILDISGLEAGIYLLRVLREDGMATYKIVKQ